MASPSSARSAESPTPTASQLEGLKSEDVQQGNILWLPPHSETLQSSLQRGDSSSHPVTTLVRHIRREKDIYNHPILVISRSEKSPFSIRFLIVSRSKIYARVNITDFILAYNLQRKKPHRAPSKDEKEDRSDCVAKLSSNRACETSFAEPKGSDISTPSSRNWNTHEPTRLCRNFRSI